jgi:hypothetical protein
MHFLICGDAVLRNCWNVGFRICIFVGLHDYRIAFLPVSVVVFPRFPPFRRSCFCGIMRVSAGPTIGMANGHV